MRRTEEIQCIVSYVDQVHCLLLTNNVASWNIKERSLHMAQNNECKTGESAHKQITINNVRRREVKLTKYSARWRDRPTDTTSKKWMQGRHNEREDAQQFEKERNQTNALCANMDAMSK